MPLPLQQIEPYLSHLEDMAFGLHPVADLGGSFQTSVEDALNGEFSKTLRNVVPLPVLRSYGAFFTDEAMSDKLVQAIPTDVLERATVLDAACGGGNLLLAHARRMPLGNNLAETLLSWGQRIHGLDLHLAFIRATKARLVLLALQRGLEEFGAVFVQGVAPQMEDVFPHVRKADSLASTWPATDYVLLNPPFNRVSVPDNCSWATGRVSLASLFTLRCLEQAHEGLQIRAILPDVLRAGSNYARWRNEIGALSEVQGFDILGAFDSQTAVDVFILTLKATKNSNLRLENANNDWWSVQAKSFGKEKIPSQKVGDLFKVNVGRVVPDRNEDSPEFPNYPYFDVQRTPAWETVILRPDSDSRRFEGTTFIPPFVLIRRNSRSKDSFRAVGTLVVSPSEINTSVAVENHLIIATPLSGRVEDCEALLQRLRTSQTNRWLDNRIRCRHLTVGAVSDIPWWNS